MGYSLYVFRAGDFLKVASIVAARGGEASYWDFYQVWKEETPALLREAMALGVVKWRRVDKPKTRVVYVLGERGRVLLDEMLAHWGMAPPARLSPRNSSHKSKGGKSSSSPR